MADDTPRKPIVTEARTTYLPLLNGGRIAIDVNWNAEVMPCKFLRLTFPGGGQGIVKKSDLVTMLMFFADPTEMEALIAKSMKPVHSYETILGIQATKAIAIGEKINIPVSVHYPADGEGPVRIFTKQSNIVLPRS
jgi:hypothetical protein